MRINKYLALCGLASRRKSEELVTEGRVRLNGRPVSSLSVDVGKSDIVTVDGKKVFPPEEHVYIMLNKPKGYICSSDDEYGRKTVMELIKHREQRLFSVGRLDYDSEGLLLLTSDGDFCKHLTHPSHEIEKAYICKIEGEINEDELQRLRHGIVLDGVKTKRCKVTLLPSESALERQTSRIEIVITEGKNRQVRRMFEALGRRVVFLKRIRIGSLSLGGLSRGEYRELKPKEIDMLKRH